MTETGSWLLEIGSGNKPSIEGLVYLDSFFRDGEPPSDVFPEQVAVVEKAKSLGSVAVFFEASRDGKAPAAQALIFVADQHSSNEVFAELHRRLWSWGGVPLAYRVSKGLVQLFRCAHKPEFVENGKIKFRPHDTLSALVNVDKAWWDAERLRNGTIWDDPKICRELLSRSDSAPRSLINSVKRLYDGLTEIGLLPERLRRKLLILSLLIAYLEDRKVLGPDFFGQFVEGAQEFFEVFANGPALVAMLDSLEERFNGNIFAITDQERSSIQVGNLELRPYAEFIEGKHTPSGQMTLWKQYSFADLPVELISNIYQLFVEDVDVAVYTPPILVKLMIGEVLSWDRIDRLHQNEEVILDPSCGSGIFLVEAYKRLVLHWRTRNSWERPSIEVLKGLLSRVHGVDLEEGAIELAAFSLCLALCDALQPEEIRATIKLFPELKGTTLLASCFFQALEGKKITVKVGVVLGNPPFTSQLKTPASQRAYANYRGQNGRLPDRQVAYLFLHHAMEIVEDGGVLAMLQQYNFLYNLQSIGFRRDFLSRWDIREILDLVSVRGLFTADTKVVVVVSEARIPKGDGQVLHATFRRNGKANAEQALDIDYYDLHWVPRRLALENDGIWRANLLGGGRVLAMADRLRSYRTLGQYVKSRKGWDIGEGFIAGAKGISNDAGHIINKAYLPSVAVTDEGIDERLIDVVPDKPIKDPKSSKRFTPPMLLIRENMDLNKGLWTSGYLTYGHNLVGICAPSEEIENLQRIDQWLEKQNVFLRAYLAATSPPLLIQRATAIYDADIRALPFPEEQDLDMSEHERIIAEDVVRYYRDLVRLGEDSFAMKMSAHEALKTFCDIFVEHVNAIYPQNRLKALPAYTWRGIICQPFVFGQEEVDWGGSANLHEKLDALLKQRWHSGLSITRIAKLYDGDVIYLIKPDRLRYWLGSVALRDADETLADLWRQGF